jgi:hypothetical protein
MFAANDWKTFQSCSSLYRLKLWHPQLGTTTHTTVQESIDFSAHTGCSMFLHITIHIFTGLTAILGIGNTLASIFTINTMHGIKDAVHDLEKTQDHVLDVIEEHEVRLTSLAISVDAMKSIMNDTIKQFNTASELFVGVFQYFKYEYLISKVNANIASFKTVINSLMLNRLSPEIAFFANITHALTNLRKKALKRGFTLIPQSIDHLYQLDVSYIIEGFLIHIMIHVPMARSEHFLAMYKYENTPIPLAAQKLTMRITDFHDVLAISHDTDVFTTLRFYDLAACMKIGSIYLCPKQNVLTKMEFLEDTCLGSLYNSNATKVVENCPHVFVPPKNSMHQISENEFLSFSPIEQKIVTRCLQINKQNVTSFKRNEFFTSGNEKIKLGKNCIAESNSFHIGTDVSINSANNYMLLARDFENPYTNYGIDDLDLKKMTKEYEQLARVPENVRNLQAVFSKRSHETKINYSIIGGIVLGLIFIVVISYCAIIVARIRKALNKVRSHVGIPLASAPPQYNLPMP